MNNYAICGEEFFAHHGILGQKWGKRNGPPYPLDPEDHSKAEKEAAKKKFSLTDDQKKKLKKAAIIGAAVVGTALVTYGAYKLGAFDKFIDLGKKYSRSYDFKGFSSELGEQNLEKASDKVRNALEGVNPSGERYHCAQNSLASCIKYSGIKGLENIQTKPGVRLDDRGKLFEECFKMADGSPAKAIHLDNEINSAKDAVDAIIENFNPKNGSCGMFEAPLKRKLSGHAIMWYMEDDKIKFSDPFFVDVTNPKKPGYVIMEDASTYFGKALYNKFAVISCLDDLVPDMNKIDEYFNH